MKDSIETPQADFSKIRPLLNNQVYILTNDASLGDALVMQLGSENFQVTLFTDTSELQALCQKNRPAAILVDRDDPATGGPDIEPITRLKQHLHPCPAIICISANDDIDSHLASSRAGSTRYFPKPLNLPRLFRSLRDFGSAVPQQTYRVLLIDDDEDLLALFTQQLQSADMRVVTLSDPHKGLETLKSFQPDLLLLDIHMPGISGVEFAQLIRQDDNFAQLPIIYLSMDEDPEQQQIAMAQGGDEFLNKKINKKVLIARVRGQIQRAREAQRVNRGLQEALWNSELRRFAVDNHAIVSAADIKGAITYVNDAFCEISGYSRKELLGKNHRLLKSGQHPATFYTEMWHTIAQGEVWHGTLCNHCKDGSEYWVKSTIVPLLDNDGLPYQYLSVRTDISASKQVEAELIAARETAEQASREKSQFLSSMSHELRTPMNAIIGFSQLLELEPLNETQHDNVSEILKASTHLLELINEVLNLSRVEAGRLDLSIEDIFLYDVMMECLALIAPLAEQRNIRIVTTHNHEEISLEQAQQLGAVVRADRIRLKQALINLLSNAVKYNHESGLISTGLHKVDDRLHINISDTGQGISADQQSQLFQPFNRLGAENSETEGTGIGLAFSKKIIELMGGSLGMESTPDKGSNFWIELPGYYQSKMTETTTKDEQINIVPSSTCEQTHIQYTVLYVEDNPANMNLMEQMLKHRPEIHLLKAHEPLLGLDLATHYQPDLIMLDINLPGMSGYDMLELLQKNMATPVIAISANAMPADIQKGLDAGFAHYITKPFKLQQLLDTLDSVFIKIPVAEVKG